jgi:hypothetical protein
VGVRVSTVAADAGGPDTTANNSTQTNNQGAFQLRRPAGRYYIVAGPVSGLVFFPGTTSRNDAEVVTVSSGAIRDAIEIRNYGGPLGFSVQGRLVPPQTGAVVRTIVGGGFNAEAVAGPDGSFILSDLPSGSHSLEPRLASPSAVPGGMRCSTVCGRILRQRMFSFLLPREVVRGPFVRLSSAP